MNRDEFLAGVRRRFDLAGGRLQKAERAFLEEATWQAYREGDLGERPKAMTGAQRKKKLDLLAKWETGLKNLALLDIVTWHSKGWFREEDLSRVLDRQTVTRIVSLSVRLFDIEYADALLQVLQKAYAREREEIVIQRHFRLFG